MGHGGDTVAVSKKKQEANRRWDKANYDQILVKLPKGTKEKIRSTGATSINGYIREAVEVRLAADGVAIGGMGDSSEE